MLLNLFYRFYKSGLFLSMNICQPLHRNLLQEPTNKTSFFCPNGKQKEIQLFLKRNLNTRQLWKKYICTICEYVYDRNREIRKTE